MQYYLAPLEGITTQIYRTAYHKYFRPMDKYFIPFLVPHTKKGFSVKEIRELSPENQEGLYVVPQILSNNGEDTLDTIRKLQEYGYKEVNLNFGCPSKTVVSKYRGSGFLAKPEELDRYLDTVMKGTKIRVSVKTRIGRDEPEEFHRLLCIYNQYPLQELIVHPRTQKDFYGKTPRWEYFAYAVKESKNPLCYNGDIFTPEDGKRLEEQFPKIEKLMLGRGVIANPFLTELMEKSSEEPGTARQPQVMNKNLLREFHDEVYDNYRKISSGDLPALFKMKELWTYMLKIFPEDKKLAKKIKKAESPAHFLNAVAELFALL